MKRVIAICNIFLAMLFHSVSAQHMNSITVVYNNIASENNLRTDWGYGAWIKMGDEVVLFDSGANPRILERNLKMLNLKPEKISIVAISHDHYDHIGGLESIITRLKKKTKVFLPGVTEINFKEKYPDLKFVQNNKFQRIAKNIWLTEVFQNNVQEQALIIENGDKLIMITGCAHPGIVEMCESVKKYFPNKKLELLTGGFHLLQGTEDEVDRISNELKLLGFNKIAPSHCTGDQSIAIFNDRWKENFIQLNLGDAYRF